MKRHHHRMFIMAAVWSVWALAPMPGAAVEPLAVGEVLPASASAVVLTDFAGAEHSLDDLWSAQGLMVVFASNTCPYMIDWLDRLPKLHAQAQADGVAFVVVNANARKRASDDAPEAMRALRDAHDWAFPYWIDTESRLADALGATRTPEVFLFSGDRQLVYQGAIDDHSGPLAEVTAHWTHDALAGLIAGETIAVPSTAPIGCAVQRPRRRRAP